MGGVGRALTKVAKGVMKSLGKVVDKVADTVVDVATGVVKGDFDAILSAASIIPSPIQPFALATSGVMKASKGDWLGAGLAGLGASGAMSNVLGGISGDGATAAGNAFGGAAEGMGGTLEEFMGQAGGGLGGAASSTGSAISGGLSSMGSSLGSEAADLGALDTSGFTGSSNAFGDVSDLTQAGAAGAGSTGSNAFSQLTGVDQTFNPTSTATGGSADMVGDWGAVTQPNPVDPDPLGSFMSNLPSDRFSPESGIVPNTTGNNWMANSFGNAAESMGMGQTYDDLTDLFGRRGLGNSLSSILQGGGNMFKAYQQYQQMKAQEDMIKDYNRQQEDQYAAALQAQAADQANFEQQKAAYAQQLASLQNIYSPDSAYAKQAAQEMMRRDAARGRRSNYSGRAQELAAALSQQQASVMSSPQYTQLMGAANSVYRAPTITKPVSVNRPTNYAGYLGAINTAGSGVNSLARGISGLAGLF